MQISYTIDGTGQTVGELMCMGGRIRQELLTGMEDVVAMLATHVVNDALSGQLLNRVTGKLASSVNGRTYQPGDGTLVGTVGADAPYARIQELGGQTSPHEILPKNASVLKFSMGGKDVYASRVYHPGSSMPARYFLRTTLYDLHDEIVQDLGDATARGVRP